MFREIELKDKEIFDKYLQGCHVRTDMMNFTSLFLWKDWCGHTTWDIINDTIVVRKSFDGEIFTFCPISPDQNKVTETVRLLIREAKEKNEKLRFTEINEEQMQYITAACPCCFATAENRDGADYIYRVSDLIDLPGRIYSSKRNHINKFLRSYPDFELHEMTAADIPLCREYIEGWAAAHYNHDDRHFQGEYQGTLLALQHFEELDVKGLCLFVNGKMEGFTIGEALSDDTVVIHIEKASAHIDGAYTMINREFLARCWHDFTYVNREEDMGMEGLRKAKLSYHPCKLEMIYYMDLRQQA